MRGRHLVAPIRGHKPFIRVRCISKKYGNFEYNKIYTAEARMRGEEYYTDYRIIDEDGDYYTLHEEAIGRIFLKIPE